jgi:rhodanese-related sulfurtransferase
MHTGEYATIDREQLAKKLGTAMPNHEDPRLGYALVNVLAEESFDRERIPGSINIPRGRESAFEQYFDKGKEIIVYCASPSCGASADTARELTQRGFVRVVDYEGGMSDWKEGNEPVSGHAV